MLSVPLNSPAEDALHVSRIAYDTVSRKPSTSVTAQGHSGSDSDPSTAEASAAEASAAAHMLSAWSRHKWDGELPLSGYWASAALLASAPAAGCSVALLVAARSLALPDCIAACLLALAALSAAGRILDQRTVSLQEHERADCDASGILRKPAARALGFSVLLVPALTACLFLQPWAYFF